MRQIGGSGEDEWFRTLYTRHYARTVRYFRTVFRVANAEAEELAQDVFIRLYRAGGDYNDASGWALLETIARNVGYNHFRARTTLKRGAVRAESLDDRDSAIEPVSTGPGPVEEVIHKEQLELMLREIANLPEGQRQCLRLWLNGWSYEEIARTLRVSLDAVRSRIRDAKRSLRAKLGDEGLLPED